MGAAVARCLRHDVLVHSVRSYTRRYEACSAMKPSSALVREAACSQRSCGRTSGRDPDAKVVGLGMSSPPLSTRLLKRPNGSLQARAVPGSDPVCQRLTDGP